ncbi:hypothetical protein HUN01_34175 [Nostoc edaphicum CCNP1411]|uniref:Virulence factor Evf domain-containing protein n=1 Tax=Nostoc edaphicum CCNP1411 TaxID=1472755 RepID=A0A7D7LHT9_9NOSO|nr:hypothetical protein [Nostoc edaphicum]QMS92394.1 hypothetical protein HUN01_34175 [Nostoc edaphicum CCNP1411]
MTNFQLTPIQKVASDYYNGKLAKAFSSPVFEKLHRGFTGIPNLNDLLNQLDKAPDTSPPSVIAIPPTIDQNIYQNLLDLQLLTSYINVVSLGLMYEIKPQGWNITDPKEATDFTRSFANSSFKVITQGLAGILNIQTQLASTVRESVTLGQAHSIILNELFGSFGFPDSTIKQLDSILTRTTKKLYDLSIDFRTQSETLDFAVLLFYFEEVMGINYKIPYMRLFYLSVDQSSWRASVKIGKSSASVERFSFNMNYTDTRLTMNSELLREYRPAMEAYIKDRVGDNLQKIQELTQPSIVDR